jgi:2-desacetyl-2-hydroxyethyl bacteriochlorophyllide A dehydrogenase
MRAVVTHRAGTMGLAEVPRPADPGPGQVLVRPEAVGICGSDYHFLTGELVTPPEFGPQFPRVQGHEVAARVAATGPGCPPGLQVGQRVALFPMAWCGECYPCTHGRRNACPNFRLIGVHVEGALAEYLTIAAEQVFPVADLDAPLAAFCEPMSIAVHAVERGEVGEGEPVVVVGGGPIGQSVALCALDRGARVMMTDLVTSRLDLARENGVEVVNAARTDTVATARRWAGAAGPPVVFECVGRPGTVRQAVDMVSSAGRVVIVGIGHEEVSLPINAFTERELSILGSTVCTREDFAEAIRIVGAYREAVARLITHERPLDDAVDAIGYAMANPDEVMKLVIRGEA